MEASSCYRKLEVPSLEELEAPAGTSSFRVCCWRIPLEASSCWRKLEVPSLEELEAPAGGTGSSRRDFQLPGWLLAHPFGSFQLPGWKLGFFDVNNLVTGIFCIFEEKYL